MEKLRVEGTNIYKDPNSSALLNNDNENLNLYRNAKRLRAIESQKIKNLEKDVSDIKEMMKMIIEKLG